MTNLNKLFEGFAETFSPTEVRRRKALEWWHNLDYQTQISFSLQTADLRPHYNMPKTGGEIEQVYLKIKGEQ